MSKIPFVLKPKREPVKEVVGNEAIGAIEVLRRGFLTVGEKALVQGAATHNNAFREVQAIAAKISKQSGKPVTEVLESMTGGSILEIVGPEMATELATIMEEMQAAQTRRQVISALAILVHRVDPDITVEDVMELHPELIQALCTFYDEEEARTWEGYIADEEEEDEKEGKPKASN